MIPICLELVGRNGSRSRIDLLVFVIHVLDTDTYTDMGCGHDDDYSYSYRKSRYPGNTVYFYVYFLQKSEKRQQLLYML